MHIPPLRTLFMHKIMNLFFRWIGGTRKTSCYNLMISNIKSNGDIVMPVASSGIASTLLQDGRTAHSAFKVRLDVSFIENSACNISKNSKTAKALRECKFIIWDECSMAHKKSLEVFDRSLKDICDSKNIMNGKVVLLAGDFRQILPVVNNLTPVDELKTCLKSS